MMARISFSSISQRKRAARRVSGPEKKSGQLAGLRRRMPSDTGFVSEHDAQVKRGTVAPLDAGLAALDRHTVCDA
jgi:hypothetical protein